MADAVRALNPWENFYVIVGSSAGALIGLQFVVIALIKESAVRSDGREISAFATPTILHFSAVLLTSAIVSAPWPTMGPPGAAFGLLGLAGVIAVALVYSHARKTNYEMVLEDWLWHVLLPLVAYAGLIAGAVLLHPHPVRALFGVGGGALLLLAIGIHNAWDTTTFVVVTTLRSRNTESK